jgi:hypothetical protein
MRPLPDLLMRRMIFDMQSFIACCHGIRILSPCRRSWHGDGDMQRPGARLATTLL